MSSPRPVQDSFLPAIHRAANVASIKGQQRYLFLNAVRLVALVVAAVAGATGFVIYDFDTSGTILAICCESGQPVEFDQPLFVIG